MPKTCLIIDDSETVRNEVRTILESADMFDSYLMASDGMEGFKALLRNQVDFILCDVIMPVIDGFKFLALKRDRAEYVEIPVIMLTGQEEMKLKIKGLEGGASDYLTKPFHPGELLARVRVHLKIKELQDELRRKNAELEVLSNTDGLTKIFNRRHFMELLELEFIRAERYQSNLSYMMIDIDHFKRLNDTYGHLVGDRILVRIAETLKENLRKNDMVARYGGEEFAMLLPETNLKGALVVAERYRQRIESLEHVEGDKSIRVAISVGVATYPHPAIKSVDDLIRIADDALYKAKQNGRNRVEVAE